MNEVNKEELRRLAEAVPPVRTYTVALAKFHHKSTPKNILSLLDENDQLQAELRQSRDAYQRLIDQTTPLVPDPKDPRWSKRIQLDEVISERDQLRAQIEGLRKDAERWSAAYENDVDLGVHGEEFVDWLVSASKVGVGNTNS